MGGYSSAKKCIHVYLRKCGVFTQWSKKCAHVSVCEWHKKKKNYALFIVRKNGARVNMVIREKPFQKMALIT